MRIHRKHGRFRAVIAAVVVAVGVLAAVSASTQPALAQASCTPSVQNVIPQWGTVQPQGPSGGITLCLGVTPGVGIQDAYLQIVDLSAGAHVRLWEDTANATCGDSACDFTAYPVRTVPDWATWIGQNTGSSDSNPAKLYSVSNAGFFTDTSGAPSGLSLPFEHLATQPDGTVSGAVEQGFALSHNSDHAWGSPKRAITFGDTINTPQEVHTFDFPQTCSDPTCTHYTFGDVFQTLGPTSGNSEWDSTVGFKPDFNSGLANARRTYVGVSPSGTGPISKVYILDTTLGVTVTQAQAILESFGSQLETQLDGGGSTQLWGNGGANLIAPNRGVPQVLAVYGS
jgi:hypothetical protein